MYRNLAYAPRRPRPQGVFKFNKWPYGLNTSVPSFQILDRELAECLNFKINKGGQQETREPIIIYSNSATASNAAVKTFAVCPIGSTTYKLLVDANHKLDYLDGSLDPTNIGTLEGDTVIIAFNGVAILLDGSYIKYCDDVASIKIAYDDGTGTSGYQFNNLTGDEDSTIKLGDGTNVRIATKFTSQAWTAGYTIPPTTFTVKLTKAGTPSATAITARLRKVSDDSILAAKVLLVDATDLTGTATEYPITFTSSDITTEMSPSVACYMSIEHAGGDAANHVLVHCSDVASGGTCYKYIAAWSQITTQDPIMGLRPGRPPKASFGAIKESRLYLAGDPDNPGYIWYSHVNTHLDFSTSDGGGYVGAIDGNANNFPVGAIIPHYGQLFILGKEDQPYLCKLTGSSPSEYSVPSLYQAAWATHKTAISVINDIWYTSKDGADALSGVEQYGDLRTFFASDPIFDRIRDYWATATAIAGYNPVDGQYWLYMPTYHRILIAHTKIPTQTPDRSIRYPWSEYELYKNIFTSSTYKWTASGSGTNEYYLELAAGGDPSITTQPDFLTLDGSKITEGTMGSLADHQWDYGDNDVLGYNTVYFRDETGDPDTTNVEIRSVLAPQCFASFGNEFYIGASDGFIYKLDSSEYKDLDTHRIRFLLKSKYSEVPFGYVNLEKLQLMASTEGGATLDVNLSKDGLEAEFFCDWDLAVYDGLEVGDALMDVDDALFLVATAANILSWRDINIVLRSFQITLDDIVLSGYPLYVDGFMLKYRQLQH